MTVRALLFALLFVLPQPAAAAEAVAVDIRWEYRNFAAAVELYEAEGRPRLWETKSVKTLADAPVVGLIDDSSFALAPGRRKRFVLVVRNETAAPLHFFAAPHVVDPVEHSLGFKFKCLCINHAFTVGPGEVWYRVVELRLSRGHVGDALTVTHSIIGIDGERAAAFSKPPGPPDF